jgi:hypothetical protein
MKQEELQKLQQELDVNKWTDGQAKGVDPCGTYDYCAKCDKAAEYPCATAKTAFEAPAKKETKKRAPKAKTVKAPVAETKAEEVKAPVAPVAPATPVAAKAEVKPAVKAEVKAEVKVEAKPVVKAEPVAVKAEPVAVKAEPVAVKAAAKKGKKRCR